MTKHLTLAKALTTWHHENPVWTRQGRAEHIGVPPPNYSRWMLSRSFPSKKYWNTLMEHYGFSPEDMLRFERNFTEAKADPRSWFHGL